MREGEEGKLRTHKSFQKSRMYTLNESGARVTAKISRDNR